VTVVLLCILAVLPAGACLLSQAVSRRFQTAYYASCGTLRWRIRYPISSWRRTCRACMPAVAAVGGLGTGDATYPAYRHHCEGCACKTPRAAGLGAAAALRYLCGCLWRLLLFSSAHCAARSVAAGSKRRFGAATAFDATLSCSQDLLPVLPSTMPTPLHAFLTPAAYL